MSEEDSLFTISEKHLDSGLRGIPVGTCLTSYVDPMEGVHYVGYPVGDLSNLEEEDVIYLLMHKRLPTKEESAAFRKELAHRGEEIPTGALRVLETLTPGTGHPMDWLSIGIMAMGAAETTGDARADSMNLIARMPELMARIFLLRGGQKENLRPRKTKLGLVENFVHMLGVDGDEAERMNRVLRFFFILHMDHGGGNLSTFSGKAVASGRASVYASLASAMNALSGPLHGRANQACLEFVQRIGTSDHSEIEDFVRSELAAKRPIYGFGHGVLRAEDPRARLLIELGSEICPDDEYFQVVKALREVVPPILKEHPKIKNPYPNVDIASGSLLHAIGFRKPHYYTTFFGWARVAGICAQILDERNSRDGRGVPIYRPKYIAKDQPFRRLD
ncbi:MAG: citrate/2-methylcitrate synthase [Candidatus Thermoplasmatota archaeon]|nr:citrate/2-methylcitrate synthase [Candidatus Thermoplasmatota archaeon]MED5397978.1 citrate/2-methylcitrate synthase [Candidatus Thermoplasmatota archaeon]|tara:strand:+ start:710 stop:1879 length:1170 start_codon:yes stop_codon:yes gene_type:complete